uniref:Uncharacterized protein n=1 Tax=Avena sativa TaxID=4498 RepID=A0ACD5Y9D8_AVESA
MAANKGIKSVVICVLVLSLVLEKVQVEAMKSCCKSTKARNCYNVCRFAGGSRPVCAICGCKIIDGSTCPSGYSKLHLFPESGEPDVTEYCTVGCMTSVCDHMDNVFPGKEMKIDMELCSNACVRLCNKGASIPSDGS